MSTNQTVEQVQTRISDLEDSLKFLESIDNEHTWNSFWSYITGVVAPVTKSSSDTFIDTSTAIFGEKNPATKGIKGGYDLIKVLIENKYNAKTDRDVNGNLLEASGIMSEDNQVKGIAHLYQALSKYKDGEMDEALFKSLETASDIAGDKNGGHYIEAFNNGMKMGKSFNESKEHFKEWSNDRDDLLKQIDSQRTKLKQEIEKEKNKLYQMTGGRLGEVSIGPKSPDVFTRINDLLATIDSKIQVVESNIRV
jgi:hypothetical protein